MNQQVPIAILTEDNDPINALAIAEKLNAIAINPDQKTLTKDNVRQIKKAGFKIYPWTVNSPSDIKRMKGLKVDGIITDYPERVFPVTQGK